MPDTTYAKTTSLGFTGLSSIFQYTNEDGKVPETVCGQAACATLLTYRNFLAPSIESLRKIEQSHPPDLFGGRLGTSPWRIDSILRHYGAAALEEVNTLSKLKTHIRRQNPVICLIQNTHNLFADGAHWFVVFAFNDAGVFVTNYGNPNHLTWEDFTDMWTSTLTAISRAFKFRGVTILDTRIIDNIRFPSNLT